jgi:hypothetical protein
MPRRDTFTQDPDVFGLEPVLESTDVRRRWVCE